jgi:hypothetical protein
MLFSAIAALVALTVLSCPPRAQAQSPGQQEAIDSAREALGSGENPWYDRERDSLRRVNVQQVKESSFDFGSLPKWIVYGVLAIALAAIIYALIRFAMQQLKDRKPLDEGQKSQLIVDEAEALPFLAERPRGDLLALARQHYEQGNYSEAIIYLFSYELIELDKGARIHLARGKTNRQYLRELGNAAPLRGPLERTLHAFESVFFGRRALDRATFEACWQELPQFQTQLRGAV